jgi:hypothetical protein
VEYLAVSRAQSPMLAQRSFSISIHTSVFTGFSYSSLWRLTTVTWTLLSAAQASEMNLRGGNKLRRNALQFGGSRGMNQVLRRGARKGKAMSTKNAGTNDSADAVAAEGAAVAPEASVATKTASRKKSTPKGAKTAKGAKSGKSAKKVGKAKRATESPRAGSKTATILDLIGRAKGATLAEMTAATGWQAHSVRGFLSTAGKKHNVKIESAKKEGGTRVYRIRE